MSIPGIDVSFYQGVIEWATVKAAADRDPATPQWASIKAGFGWWLADPQWAANWKHAHAVGFPVGAYLFAYPQGTTDAEIIANAQQHAAFFLKQITAVGGYRGSDLRPMLDLEIANGLGPAQLQLFATHFCADVDAALGATPDSPHACIVYTNVSFYRTNLSVLPQARWLAAYQPTAPALGEIIWQASDQGHVAGIGALTDQDQWLADWPTNAPPVAPVVTWTPIAKGIAWSFAAPADPAYEGWAQAIDTPADHPMFHTTSGWYATRWVPPGDHTLILTFWFGGVPVSVHHAVSGPLTEAQQIADLTARLTALSTQEATDHAATVALQAALAKVEAELAALTKGQGS